MVQKIHDFRDAHKLDFTWHHILAAVALMIFELAIHELELHLIAVVTTISVAAKDIIKDTIEKCEEFCGSKDDK